MIDFIKDKLGSNVNKVILGGMFFVLVGVCVHLMHKQDAGGDEAAFITWAETTATFVLTKLVTIMFADEKILDNPTDVKKD